MKFKKYVKESVTKEPQTLLDEGIFDSDSWNPDKPSIIQDEIDRFYAPVRQMIEEGRFEEARAELADLEADLNELDAANSKKKFFRFPQFMIDGQRRRLDALKAKIPANESVSDMDKRCEKCNTLLNDGGTCPKCDDGEEDYGDETKDMNEEMSVRERLKAAYPELNFDSPMHENCVKEELTNREKLLRAFPELNFDSTTIEESVVTEKMSNREKLKAAYPELNFEGTVEEGLIGDISVNLDASGSSVGFLGGTAGAAGISESTDNDPEDEFDDYDDEYDFEDDVEMDRRHAALYGGDRMYCDCGRKLSYDEYGSYCPVCDPKDPESVYSEGLNTTDCNYMSKETSFEIASKIARAAAREMNLPENEVEMLEHDINNLRSTEWVDSFADLPNTSKAKQMFFKYAVEVDSECFDDEI